MTKIILTIVTSMCFTTRDPSCDYSCAGDDICGSADEVNEINERVDNVRLVGLIPNDKTIIGTEAFMYCETIMTHGEFKQYPEESQNPAFVDYFKLRLFSVFQKTNADSSTSPLFGRVDQMLKLVQWMRNIFNEGDYRDRAKRVFYRNFKYLIPKTVVITLPSPIG